MGIKEYLEKKREGFEKYKAKRDLIRQERERRYDQKLKLDAQAAESDLAKLKERERHQKKIDSLHQYKSKNKKPNKFGSTLIGISDFAKGFDVADRQSSSVFGSGDFGLGGSSSGYDFLGNQFEKPKKKRKRRRK